MKPCYAAMICLLVGCASSEPTVELTETGGFVAGAFQRGVRISGNEVTFRRAGLSRTEELKRSDRDAIFDALDAINFLELEVDDSNCKSNGADFPTATIHADLPAGSNTVEYYTACEGEVYDQLQSLNESIYEISGYNRWLAGMPVPFVARR